MEIFGNYTIIKTLSERGATSVYLAVHNKLGRKTLLKVYSGGDAALINRFEREARIVADMDDESIVAIYDFGEFEGRFYICMEYVDGQNLRDYVKSHQLTDKQIIHLALQIAKSVSVLHSKGYIHRDLKPENILIDAGGKIKISDFGTAMHGSLVRVTNDGDLLGTPLYMAPEQINNLSLASSCDVFALGVIYYELAAGFNPFEAEQYGEVFSNILSRDPPALKTIRPSLPQWFADLVDKLLQKEAKTRVHNALEIVRIIEANLQLPEMEKQRKPFAFKPYRAHFMTWTTLIFASVLMVFSFFVFNKDKKNNITDDTGAPAIPPRSNTTMAADSANDHQFQAQPSRLARKSFLEQELQNTSDSQKQKSVYSDLAVRMPADSVAQQPQATTVLVKTWPWCKVYLNYRYLDTTPMASAVAVEPGKYLLSLNNPSYPTWSDSILIRPHFNNELGFSLDSLFYCLDLQVTPWGEVFVDDDYVGTTPLPHPIYLSFGSHVIKVRNSFYQTWVDTIVCNGQKKIQKNVVLQELQ